MFKIFKTVIFIFSLFVGLFLLYSNNTEIKNYINKFTTKTIQNPNLSSPSTEINNSILKESNISIPQLKESKKKTLGRCDKPISYNIGNFDPRFKISQTDFLNAIQQAESIWEKELNKNLFQYDQTNGIMSVNLVYDYRQETGDKLRELGIVVSQNRASYEEVKTRYTNLLSSYTQLKNKYDQDVSNFNKRSREYESQVKYWNTQGGAPEEEYNKLTQEKTYLETEVNNLKNELLNINQVVNQINGLANTLNKLVEVLNLNVNNYNTIGETLGDSFEEGLYKQDGEFRSIDIYEYQNTNQLVRVLAHELGHALGIGHLDNKDSIMHYMNLNEELNLTQDDKDALANICGLVY